MQEILKQNEGIKSGHDIGEPETKGWDRIWTQCQRTRIQIKGLNLGAISKNLKQKERIESERDVGDPKTKRRDRIRTRYLRTRNKRKGSNLGAMPENSNKKRGSNLGAISKNLKQKERIESRRKAKEPESKHRD